VEAPTGRDRLREHAAGRKVPADRSLVLLLENIQDPGNVGTLLRSAARRGGPRRAFAAMRLRVVAEGACAPRWGRTSPLNIVEGADLAGIRRNLSRHVDRASARADARSTTSTSRGRSPS
jgi:hypothetical protein